MQHDHHVEDFSFVIGVKLLHIVTTMENVKYNAKYLSFYNQAVIISRTTSIQRLLYLFMAGYLLAPSAVKSFYYPDFHFLFCF